MRPVILSILCLLVISGYFLQKQSGLDLRIEQIEDQDLQEYLNWREVHGKSRLQASQGLDNQDIDEYRFMVWKQNLKHVREFMTSNKPKTYTIGMNKFADLTLEEFASIYLSPKSKKSKSVKKSYQESNEDVQIDWKRQGVLGIVKDQGYCASGYAFASIGALQTYNYLSNSVFQYYSEQLILNEGQSYGQSGCDGGILQQAFQYAIQQFVVLEEKCPYVGYLQKDGCKDITTKDEIDLVDTLKSSSPGVCDSVIANLKKTTIAVTLEAYSVNFQLYTGGIFSSEDCSGAAEHSLLLTGFLRKQTISYWTLQNSWGRSWGESGFLKLESGNSCFICDESFYAIDSKKPL